VAVSKTNASGYLGPTPDSSNLALVQLLDQQSATQTPRDAMPALFALQRSKLSVHQSLPALLRSRAPGSNVIPPSKSGARPTGLLSSFSIPEPVAQGANRARQQKLPADSEDTLALAEQFAGDVKKLKSFLARLPRSAVGIEIRRLLNAAVCEEIDAAKIRELRNEPPLSEPLTHSIAKSLLGNLKKLGVNTSSYEASLQAFRRSQSEIRSHSADMPTPENQLARRTLAPATRTMQPSDAASSEVVPQNTVAMVAPGNRSVRQLVTRDVYDCVVLTYWDPATKSGGLAHIPVGSNADLSPLVEELKRQGLSPAALQFSLLGGNSNDMTEYRGKNVPTAVFHVQSVQRQLTALGVPSNAIGYHTMRSRAEYSTAQRNIGLDLASGKPFFFNDPNSVLPKAKARGVIEFQDRITDLYVVTDETSLGSPSNRHSEGPSASNGKNSSNR
jgi:chemotaxis receptor (MCP) glutamine deamidase CheD